MARETGVQSQVESYQRLKQWYLMPPCLTLSTIKYGLRVKWSNTWKAVTPCSTFLCSTYWKGSLLVALVYGRQLYLFGLLYLWIKYCISMIVHISLNRHRVNGAFLTIVFIFIVISTTFRPICPQAYFRYMSNSGTYSELQTTSFI